MFHSNSILKMCAPVNIQMSVLKSNLAVREGSQIHLSFSFVNTEKQTALSAHLSMHTLAALWLRSWQKQASQSTILRPRLVLAKQPV